MSRTLLLRAVMIKAEVEGGPANSRARLKVQAEPLKEASAGCREEVMDHTARITAAFVTSGATV